jgi:hypothetical protein
VHISCDFHLNSPAPIHPPRTLSLSLTLAAAPLRHLLQELYP